MNETALYEVLEIEKSENSISDSKSENLIDEDDDGVMKVGILGCGAIANLIADFFLESKLNVDLRCFYDRDRQRAEKLAARVDGSVASDVIDMLDEVDLVVEAASP
ncbi:MAG: Gfo/Idh/MocA family oxidoreductase, partial [Methanothermobacter sp.]